MREPLHPGRMARPGGTGDYQMDGSDTPAEKFGLEIREIEELLSQQFGSGNLRIYYQPMFEISTGEIFGAEALLRWAVKRGGTVHYEGLTPLHEDLALSSALDLWALEQACLEARGWRTGRRRPPLSVFVNLSDSSLRETGHLEQQVHGVLQRSGLEGSRLGLEISEQAVMPPAGSPAHSLQRLRDLGASIALDDFGTGYSSLSRLSTLHTDYLKLDKSFVASLRSSPGSRSEAVIEAVTSLAHSLGNRVIAEGIESPWQLRKVRQTGCDLAQGYHLSAPLKADEFTRLIGAASTEG